MDTKLIARVISPTRLLWIALGLLLALPSVRAAQLNGHTLGGLEQFPIIGGTSGYSFATAQDISNFVGSIPPVIGPTTNLSPGLVTDANSAATQNTATWMSYLTGTSNPNPVVFGGATSLNAGGVLSGTFTGSPTLSGSVSLTGGGNLAGTFIGSPTFSGSPVFSGITGNGSALTVTATGGTTAQTAAAWAANVTWAKFAGVKCDGTSDDTSALTTLLAAASLQKIIMPAGTCLVSTTLFVPHSSVEIEGNGIGQTIIKNTHGVGLGPVIEVGNITGFVAANDVFIHDLTIDGNQSASGTRRDDGIWTTTGSLRTRITNVEVKNTGDNGIELGGSNADVYGNYVHDNYTNGIYVNGWWNGSTAFLAQYNWIHNNEVDNNSKNVLTWDGIDIDPMSSYNIVENNTVTGNDIILFETGVNVASSTGNNVTDNLIINSPENCVDVSGYQNFWQIVNNLCYATTKYGIFTNTSGNHGRIAGNTISSPSSAGVMIGNGSAYTGTPSYIDIEDNKIDNPSAASGVYPGILLNTGSNITVRRNHITDSRGTPDMKYSIETALAAADTTIVVEHNDVMAGTAGTMNVLPSQLVRSNAGYTTPFNQTFTASSGTITQTSGATNLDLLIYGAGGPGGTGATCGAAASCSGGAGGGGAGHVVVVHARWADLGATSCTVAVAQPVAAGGAVNTTSSVTCGAFVWVAATGGSGQNGASAANSGGGGGGGLISFGNNGSGGTGGTGGNGGGAGGSGVAGTNGNNGLGSGGAGGPNAAAGIGPATAVNSATGGGSGGGCNAGAATAGSTGGRNDSGLNSTVGGDGVAGHGSPGTGGGGSASSTSTAANGGHGGLPGGGGGGGGSGCNGTGVAGTGGTSGGGEVWATQS